MLFHEKDEILLRDSEIEGKVFYLGHKEGTHVNQRTDYPEK